MNAENQSDTALLMHLPEPAASSPRPSRIRETIHCIRLIFGCFMFYHEVYLRQTRIYNICFFLKIMIHPTMTTILSTTTNGKPSSRPGISLKFIPLPPGDQCQREENRGYHGQELHIAVLPGINLCLICLLDLLGVFEAGGLSGS